MKLLRAYPNNLFVTRPSQEAEAKAAGPKGPEAWLYVTLRTFWADNAGIGFRSRPQ